MARKRAAHAPRATAATAMQRPRPHDKRPVVNVAAPPVAPCVSDCESLGVAMGVLDAQERGGGRAIDAARARATRLFCKWKQQPSDLPPAPTTGALVLRERGITLLPPATTFLTKLTTLHTRPPVRTVAAQEAAGDAAAGGDASTCGEGSPRALQPSAASATPEAADADADAAAANASLQSRRPAPRQRTTLLAARYHCMANGAPPFLRTLKFGCPHSISRLGGRSAWRVPLRMCLATYKSS
eukprot:2192650-Prymnesium_polylepis.1